MSPLARITNLVGLSLLLALMVLGGTRSTQARMDPYYVLRGLSTGDVRPQILFVVDTSGSMSWRAQASADQCAWGLCEGDNGTQESRISAARRTIANVVDATQDSASFGLMTFEQFDPPTAVPPRCSSGNRFHWVTWYGAFYWAQIFTHGFGVQGTWRLCQGDQQRPYPYLRWDELGAASPVVANHQSGELPPSPLLGTPVNLATNAYRRVQWFPRFMGVRAQLNETTDPDRVVLNGTVGDWGADAVARNANVWRQDFYYWPYVDGFPNYAATTVWPYENGVDAGGVVGEDPSVQEAKLYAPFYLELDDNPAISQDDWGPDSQAEALATVLDKTAPLTRGGVDATGGTPWASVIGSTDTMYPMANTEGSHRSVASYLNFVTQEATGGLCAPTTAVLLTDGLPSSGEGGTTLYSRLADLREDLGVKVYVVGFFQNSGEINNMACAAAGACDGGVCGTPCDDNPTREWDTCADPEQPASNCAYLANSSDELAEVLTSIITAELEVALPSGPGAAANEFGVGAGGAPGSGDVLQTTLSASTQWPGWRGSVRRELCDHRDDDGELLAACVVPSPEWSLAEVEETFGPCPQSHAWDAGECLQATAWNERRLFTTNTLGLLIPVAEPDGTATALFRTELLAQGLIAAPDVGLKANEIAAFILGRDWPDDWKLPGLASSAPTLIRRVPTYRAGAVPSVAVRDPHCGGRRLSTDDSASLPASLEAFAEESWGASGTLDAPSAHYAYQEAVLIGDDLGVLHAFQYNSGNELWGLLPRALLQSAVEQSQYGAAAVGQPEALSDHVYGISATVNEGYVFDDSAVDPDDHMWRHLAVFGFGPGGSDYVALDVSHMSPASPRGPVEVLWSTRDPLHNLTYHNPFTGSLLGETWARPALTFHVPGDDMSNEPDPLLVMGSGYGDGEAGRHLLVVDALTGDLVDQAEVAAPTDDMFDSAFGLVVDPSVATHCLSRFWAEAQESYILDPSGRLFRWDLGRASDHSADSGGAWNGQAKPIARFPACLGAGSTCTVSPDDPGEPFLFAPAVTANDRIDDTSNAAGGLPPEGNDQLLVAMISGSHSDGSSNSASPEGNTFHSSLYLLADDHRAVPEGGMAIPDGAPKLSPLAAGDNPGYLRIALSDLSRTRRFVPYPDGPELEDTRRFSPTTRPIRSPRIETRGVVDGSTEVAEVVDGVEVVRVTYFVHEPPTESCDPRFYDASTDTWHVDQGATFQINFELTTGTTSGFDFSAGADEDAVGFSDPGYDRGLHLASVEQSTSSGCEDGNCGPQPTATPLPPCDNNTGNAPTPRSQYAVPLSARQISGFDPIEG